MTADLLRNYNCSRTISTSKKAAVSDTPQPQSKCAKLCGDGPGARAAATGVRPMLTRRDMVACSAEAVVRQQGWVKHAQPAAHSCH